MKTFYKSIPIPLQYILTTLLVISISTSTMVYVVTALFEDYIIKAHVDFYPKIVNIITQSNSSILSFLEDGAVEAPASYGKNVFLPLTQIGDVFKIKVWNLSGIVVWSDDQRIIGTKTIINDEFMSALKGKPVYSVEHPNEDPENALEADRGVILEVYTPILLDGNVVGVIEVYEATAELYKSIQNGKLFIILTGVAFGTLLYLLQFSIFYNSHTRQKELSNQLDRVKDATLFALASLAENRDVETGQHIERTALFVKLLAKGLSANPKYKQIITPQFILELERAAPLHDIGKVGIPDAILLKPGPLTADEFNIIKTHTDIGAKTLQTAENRLQEKSYLTTAIAITKSHHEKWDGTGYPEGLIGDNIPLSARIMAIADVYDALRSTRPYKASFSHLKVYDMILQESGHHFDPDLIAVFKTLHHEMAQIFDENQEKSMAIMSQDEVTS